MAVLGRFVGDNKASAKLPLKTHKHGKTHESLLRLKSWKSDRQHNRMQGLTNQLQGTCEDWVTKNCTPTYLDNRGDHFSAMVELG